MALIFLGVLIVFTISSFEFRQVRSPTSKSTKNTACTLHARLSIRTGDIQYCNVIIVLTKIAHHAENATESPLFIYENKVEVQKFH